MKYLCLLILVIAPLYICGCEHHANSDTTADGEIMTIQCFLKSSFNPNVEIVTLSSNEHIIQGTDSITGYSWPNDLPGNNQNNYFNYVLSNYADYLPFVDTRIEEVTVPNSNATRALYIEFKKDDPNISGTTRNMYNMFGDECSTNSVQRMNQGYIKYRIKMHIELGGIDWALPLEWKPMGEDGFRMGLYVYHADTLKRYWVAKGQMIEGGSLGEDLWIFENHTVAVPQDEWFEIEAYWFGHADSDIGKLKIAINGEVLFDIVEQTKDVDDPMEMYYFMPFKVYGAIGHSWITDVEFWSRPPKTSVLYGL